ncbi:hydroxyacid dehydrogenase [Rhizobium sp. CECT 9324]|uniref:hydroxyacid dehydrogenase n=1 Tax=Rhizobium sp. CECT 9324 TaxID=2845820 RepID=UPI001E4E3BDD|nr:hydroxyacid dehydrogenase [Rhizobium sp. CECT 9324]CAH0342827.1 Glyoxylate/hydroxypyruvate reductase B [Rhizobium sp. CECT 9324]
MSGISELPKATQHSVSKGASASVLVTGAELAAEAGELFERFSIKAVYADGYSGSEKLAQLAADHQVDAILVRQGQITDTVISASPRLRVIAKHGSGVDNIDLLSATTHRIPVLRALAANAQSVAELALTLSLTAMKDINLLNTAVKGGNWPKTKYVGRDIAGARFGIVGFGEIGRRAAKLAQGIGMETLAYDPFAMDSDGTRVTRELNEVLSSSDIISLHCPLTPETHHLVNAERLALMKPGAFVVNTSRGAVIDETALFDALTQNIIAGAALDSFEEEPPRADHPLWGLPNLIATPHVGGASRSALRNMAVQSAQHIVDVLTGQAFDRRALANTDLT